MDPLSITASIISVLGTGSNITSALEKVSMVRQAPLVILAFRNEISDLRSLTYEAQNLLRIFQGRDPTSSEAQRFIEEVTPILRRGLEELLELEKLIEYELLSPRLSTSLRVRKISWFWNQEKIRAIQEQIRSFRMSLATIIALASATRLSRIELEVSGIQLNQRALQASLNRTIPELIGAQHRSAEVFETALQVITASQTGTRSSGQTYSIDYAPDSPGIRRPWNQGIHLVQDVAKCSLTCACRCHSQSALTWRTSSFWQAYIGLLVINFTGVPLVSEACDDQYCSRKSQSALEVKYSFPRWLLPCVLDFHLRISQTYRVSQGIRISIIYRFWTPCFFAIQTGDLEQLRRILGSRKCSPFDLDKYGNTALDEAIISENLLACRLLLDAGSDPHSENFEGRTTYETVWEYILRRPASDPTTGQWQTMFPDPDLDRIGLTPIHKAVLKLRPGNLDEELTSRSRNTIDEPDSRGRTPLFWAASRGDCKTMSTLLHFGASVNKAANPGDMPLWTAIRSGSRSCVELLLAHGADPNNYGSRRLPIDALGRYSDDTEMLKILLDAHIDINQVGLNGTSVLTIATQSCHTKLAMELINVGADIHHCEEDGTNSLYMATYFNNHPLIQLLLLKGADHLGDTHIPLGPYLHLIAESADLETLQLLVGAISRRDIYHRREDGLTAIDVAQSRPGADDSWQATFQELIRSVYDPKLSSVIGS